jgi:hypothetical protein
VTGLHYISLDVKCYEETVGDSLDNPNPKVHEVEFSLISLFFL